jgi:ribosomal protein L29
MKYKELTTKSEAEVKKVLQDLRSEAHDLTLKLKLNQLKNVSKLGQVKKDIARVMTFLGNIKVSSESK